MATCLMAARAILGHSQSDFIERRSAHTDGSDLRQRDSCSAVQAARRVPAVPATRGPARPDRANRRSPANPRVMLFGPRAHSQVSGAPAYIGAHVPRSVWARAGHRSLARPPRRFSHRPASTMLATLGPVPSAPEPSQAQHGSLPRAVSAGGERVVCPQAFETPQSVSGQWPGLSHRTPDGGTGPRQPPAGRRPTG